MFDVHALKEKVESFRDFLLHILTITIGLLIALALEGLVEWRHHRNLVREAEASLRGEITQNRQVMEGIYKEIDAAQAKLDQDLRVLDRLRTQTAAQTAAEHASIELAFHISGFNDVAWKTAQNTGALNYMPYGEVQAFSGIYDTQSEVQRIQQQVLDDVVQAGALIVGKKPDTPLSAALIDEETRRIGQIKMRLYYQKSIVDSLRVNFEQYRNKP